MPDRVTKETIYADLEEIRRRTEVIRDIHHDCTFAVLEHGKSGSGCFISEKQFPLGPACGDTEKVKIMPADVLEALRTLATRVQEIVQEYAEFYRLNG